MDVAGGTIRWVIDADSKPYENQLKKADNQANEFSKNLNKIDFKGFSSNASAAFGGLADRIAGVVKSIAVLGVGAGGIGTLFVKSAADLQQTSKSMEVLTGNVDVANKLFSQLAQYANNTPFEFPDIAKAGKTLLGFGIQADKVFGNVKMLGDIAAATGADFGSLAVVFGQVNATGRLMGQDALQLINNNIPITTILAKKLGKSVQQVKQDMEEGKVSADLFNEALVETTQKGGFAFKGVDVLAQSFNGRMSTLKDTVLEFGRNLLGVRVDPELGLVIKPGGIFDRLSNLLPRITKELSKLTPKITGFIDVLVNNGPTVVAVLSGVAAAFTTAKVAATLFAIAAAVNPITIFATALLVLVGVLVALQVKSQAVTDAWNKLFEFFRPAAQWFNANLLPILSKIANVVGGQLAAAWRDLKAAAFSLWQTLQPYQEQLKAIAIVLGVALLAPLLLVVAAFVAFVGVVVAVVTVGARLLAWGAKVVAWLIDFALTAHNKMQEFRQAITDALAGAIKKFSEIKQKIMDAFSGAAQWLFNVGKDIVAGLVKGMKSAINSVKDTAGNIGDAVKNKVKSILGISSPSKVFYGFGQNISQGLVNGINSGMGNVQAVASDLSSGVQAPVSGGDSSTTNNSTVKVEVNMNGIMARSRSDLREIGTDIIRAVDEGLKAKGLAPIAGGNI